MRLGRNTKVNAIAPSLPQAGAAILDWLRPMTFATIQKSVVNFASHEERTEFKAKAMLQPLSATRISMKPEGQRSWRWQLLHALPDLVLALDEVVVIDDVEYRVMAKSEYAAYGYVSYEVTQDYE